MHIKELLKAGFRTGAGFFAVEIDCREDDVFACAAGIGPIAIPDQILIAPGLPKTRSGKIIRRIASQEAGDLGDISTLANPCAVDPLIEKRAGL